MKYLVAVSGGIDSVVLLDMLTKSHSDDLTVAHFDHGIREDSAADARFVEGLARSYGLTAVISREELGAGASEERARERRYAFLRKEAARLGAVIVTAHHQDDIVESITINLIRGTGWRGLAVFGARDVKRPLLRFSKDDIRAYALTHKLEWVEDSTNAEDTYLRNRVRRRLRRRFAEPERDWLIELWKKQREIKAAVNQEANRFLEGEAWSRYFLTAVDQVVGVELLRIAVKARTEVVLTRPQAERALLAVKTARPGSAYEAGSGVTLRFKTTTFIA